MLQCGDFLRKITARGYFVSPSLDIYTNLALEQWIYKNLEFNKDLTKPFVLIWRDKPCVVIGRHQNPWLEANLEYMSSLDIKLARRYSGGGCVYHDENNINISVISDRKGFNNRQENLRFLANFLDNHYGLKFEPTPRHDLVHIDTKKKVTGSAAQLGKMNSYHHFTLLVDSSKDRLYQSLRTDKYPGFSKTQSIPSLHSKVINLRELDSSLTVDKIMQDLVGAYAGKHPNGRRSGPPDCGDQEELHGMFSDKFHGFLDTDKEQLQSWDWLYGMTPRFELDYEGQRRQVSYHPTKIVVNRGRFEQIELHGDSSLEFKYLIGTKFTGKEEFIDDF